MPASTPEQGEQDDDRNGNAEQPEQDGTTHRNLLEVGCEEMIPVK
jgi:hypothetical protein